VRLQQCLVFVVLAMVGCSSEGPTIEPLSDSDLSELASIDFDGLKQRVSDNKGKLVVTAFWSSDGKDSKAVYAELGALCAAKGQDAPLLLAVNIDRPDDVRKNTLPFLREQKTTFENRVYKGDVMMLMNWFGQDWSGWLPAICIHNADGQVVGKFFGKNAAKQASATLKQLTEDDEG